MKIKNRFLKYTANVLLLLFAVTDSLKSQTTYYVDIARTDNSGAGTSWASAKKDLQVAINIASSGDQIWVKAGTYLPTHDPFASTTPANNRDKTFTLKNAVRIYGGFAGTETLLAQRNVLSNLTTLSGDLGVVNNVTDNAYHVVLSVNCTNTTRLDGFTITKGYAVAIGGSNITVGARVIDRYKGGGVSNYYSSPTFSNCTITANSADCSDTNDDSWGAGMDCLNSSSLIENCSFVANGFLAGGGSFGVFGSGLCINGTGITISKCFFYNNTSGSGFFDGSKGGAINLSGTATVTNTVFYNNSAQNGAALSMGGGAGNTSTFTNCSFVNNTSSFAGTAYSGFSKSIFRNCIFWNNTPTVTSVSGRNEIYSQETTVANQPTFTNCIIRDATGTPLAVTNTIISNSLNGNPLFAAQADGDGPDNIWGTSDDGLRLQCASPAISAGTGATPTDDVLNLPRTTTIDIGAYEGGHTSSSFNAIPSINTIVQLTQNASGATHYSDCSSKLLEVQSGGAYTISGVVTARVWIESTQPTNFVKRHYEITPQQNATTATGRVTLYFRQQEFTDFNAVNAVKLPTGPADALGIANIQLEKRGGTSSNGSGLPATYSGTIQTINNAALGISWNAAAARWEISFDVAGFSGFFLKTQSFTLPLYWLAVSGNINTQKQATINWQVQESNVARYEIEKSSNGRNFIPIAFINSKGDGTNSYSYTQLTTLEGISFFRIKQTDIDGRFTYSTTIKLSTQQNTVVSVFPSPSKDVVTVSVGRDLLNTKAILIDMNGKILHSFIINTSSVTINMVQYSNALYLLKFENGTKTIIIKQ